MYSTGPQETGFSALGIDGDPDSPLMQMLMGPAIVPGSEIGYQLCKTLYSYHPLGAILTDAPITRAQSQERTIKVPGLAESRLVERYWKVWKDIGREGASVVLHDLASTSRRYGIASLGVGERGKELSTPLDTKGIAKADLFFNVLDPLNTSGSLVLNQNANSPGFLKPDGDIRVQNVRWHPSRMTVKMNERPIYIQWEGSAFGFVGRSVYQRVLYQMKSYIQTTITDDMIAKKAGLLVAKMKSPASAVTQLMAFFAGVKRGMLKGGVTGQVLSISVEESIETLNFTNLEAPYKLARENILKNIASGAGMPASIIAQETLTEGFGEGTEDFKKEVQYLNFMRKDLAPAYADMDHIVMLRAWTPEFFETLKFDYKELRGMKFDTWLFQAMEAFTAEWPNLNEEPDSEKSKTEDVQFKAVVALLEVMLPELDPENKVALLMWAADNVNEREALFASKLVLDDTDLQTYFEENKKAQEEALAAGPEDEEPKEPHAFAAAS